jgi:Na+/proline symporter
MIGSLLVSLIIILVVSLFIVLWRRGSQLAVSLCSVVGSLVVFSVALVAGWLTESQHPVWKAYASSVVASLVSFSVLDLSSKWSHSSRGARRDNTHYENETSVSMRIAYAVIWPVLLGWFLFCIPAKLRQRDYEDALKGGQ